MVYSLNKDTGEIKMTEKKKGFFRKLIDKLDKKMEEKAKKSCCEDNETCCK